MAYDQLSDILYIHEYYYRKQNPIDFKQLGKILFNYLRDAGTFSPPRFSDPYSFNLPESITSVNKRIQSAIDSIIDFPTVDNNNEDNDDDSNNNKLIFCTVFEMSDLISTICECMKKNTLFRSDSISLRLWTEILLFSNFRLIPRDNGLLGLTSKAKIYPYDQCTFGFLEYHYFEIIFRQQSDKWKKHPNILYCHGEIEKIDWCLFAREIFNSFCPRSSVNLGMKIKRILLEHLKIKDISNIVCSYSRELIILFKYSFLNVK